MPEPTRDESQRLTLGQLERDVFHGLELAAAEDALSCIEVLAELAHVENDRIGRPDAALALVQVHRLRAAVHEILDHGQAHRPAVQPGPALQQRLGVRILRILEHGLRGTLLADLAIAHDHDVVRDLADDREVVGDEQHRHLVPTLQLRNQVQDLLLNRNVERRRRLVGDQELGLAGDRHRDLTAAAGRRHLRGKACLVPARGMQNSSSRRSRVLEPKGDRPMWSWELRPVKADGETG